MLSHPGLCCGHNVRFATIDPSSEAQKSQGLDAVSVSPLNSP
jgi:hypothetical protein